MDVVISGSSGPHRDRAGRGAAGRRPPAHRVWCAATTAGRRDRLGSRRPGRSTPPPSRASTAWCTWPAPASATTAGPTTTSCTILRSRTDRHASCSPARSPACHQSRRRCWCPARPSATTAIVATRCSTRPARPATGFLPEVCVAWEAGTAAAAEAAGIRVAHIRIGRRAVGRRRRPEEAAPAVQARRSAASSARVGSGRAGSRSTTRSAPSSTCSTDDVAGPVNLTAPNPVTNAEFTKTLARRARPAVVPAHPLVRAEARARRRAGREPCCSTGQRVLPRRALADSGYPFPHPTLEVALRSVLGKPAAA